MASWCKADSVKTQYMDSGRFFFRPNSFHLVPGQRTIPLADAIAQGDCWDAHYYWQLSMGGVDAAWCSTIISLGSIQGHRTTSSVSSYPVIRAILTNGSHPSTAAARNSLIGGSEQCEGNVAGTELIASFPQCNVLTGNFISECNNPAPTTKVPPDGVSPACEYEDCGRTVPCHPCEAGSEEYGGPSEKLPTTYWALNFENFIKDFMGVNQPDDKTHNCARTEVGKSSYGMETRTANLECSEGKDCSMNYCADSNLDTPSATDFDRPASASDAWRDIGSHGSNRGVSWNFTSYEMRYTNIEDPGDPEYNNKPEPDCESSSVGLWDEFVYFQDGLGKTFPECPDTSEDCQINSGFFKEEEDEATGEKKLVPIANVTRDTPNCTYDPCWIGWTGGGKLPDEPACVLGELKPTRWVRYYDRDLENEDCPPKKGKQYCSYKYPAGTETVEVSPGVFETQTIPCCFNQKYDGDIVPVPGWVEPEHRIYDYWCLIANHNRCLNVNLLLEGAEADPFNQKTIFFNDPAFMSSRICNAGRGLKNWRIPPCAKNETDFTSVNKYPSKTYCHIIDPPDTSKITECQL